MALWTVNEAGTLALHLHPGQSAGHLSTRRIIALLAGSQGGKTSYLPWWLEREIRTCGPGDYLAGTASYDLFKLKFLPAMRECFEHVLRWGRYWASDRVIELAEPGKGFWAKRGDDPMWARIILRSAESGGGLESSTARAAVLDEAGMDSFTIDTYLAVLRRLALHRGRLLLGTTIYNLGWVKTQIYDRWLAGDPEVDVIQFDSTMNPTFPRAEYEAARARMPAWKFAMFYRGQFTRPAGLIYDCFDPARHVVDPAPIPAEWPRYLGLDFGGVNTAAVFLAREPGTQTYTLYREYHAGDRTAAEHVAALQAGEPTDAAGRWVRPTTYGGAASEKQWRKEFAAAGLRINAPPVSEVEIGINRVYSLIKQDQLRVSRACAYTLEQLYTYSRAVDAAGDPLEAIRDKATFHALDALRYVGSTLTGRAALYVA